MEPLDQVELANRCFSDALNIPAAGRREFVEKACGSNPSLRDNVLMLLSQFDRLGDFMEAHTPEAAGVAHRELRSGDLLAGRFRIIEEIGRGGMGEVYRADDLTLAELVALKTVRADWRSDAVAFARFRDEIRFSRRVSHPNVCRTFDLFEGSIDGQEIVFFTMQFLDGETLAEFLEGRGKLLPEEVLEIARGIAAGLDAAHHENVIHRDLKPANIILIGDGESRKRPVITDFGLAKAVDAIGAGESHTATRQILGTPDYMAPEQFLGEEITPSTDVFSFGLIVYRMLAGCLPFRSDNVVRSAMNRIMGQYTPLASHVPSLPPQWEEAFTRALAPDPARRPSSAGEFVAMLEQPPTALRRTMSRIPRRALLYSGAGLALAGIGSFLRFRSWEPTFPTEPLVMLTPFTHSIDPKGDARATEALDLVLANQLQQSPHIRVLTKERIDDAWRRISGTAAPVPQPITPSTSREIALREGASFVLFGNLTQVGDDRVLQLRLELMGSDPLRARRVWPKDFSVQRDADLPMAMFDGAQWVRKTMGESASELEAHNRRPEELTTSSWQALQEYSLAETSWRAGDSDAAILHLNTAIQLDDHFAWAYGRLADMLLALNRQDEGFPYYEKATEIMRQRNLTDRESLRIQGLFAMDTGQYARAEQVFSRYALEYPRDGLPLFYKAGCVAYLGRLEEGLKLLDMAIEREPDRYSYRMARAIRLLAAGKLDEAQAEGERSVARANVAVSKNDWTDQLRGALAFARFDAAGVRASLERMRTAGSISFQSKSFGLEACWRAEHGLLSEAESVLRDGMRFDRESNRSGDTEISKHRLLALVLVRQNKLLAAIQICREVLEGSPSIQTKLEIGAVLARAGDLTGARGCLPVHFPKEPPESLPIALPAEAEKKFVEWPIYWRRLLLLWAEIALNRGKPAVAFQLLKDAPRPEISQEFPTTLVRASLACGENRTAIAHLNELFDNPGAFWFHADFTGPGFMREALLSAERVESLVKRSALLRQFLNQSN